MSQRGPINPNFVVFLLLVFLLNSGGSRDNQNPSPDLVLEQQIKLDRERLDILHNATFTDQKGLSLNSTFDYRQYLATLELDFQNDRESHLPYHRNLSSSLVGSWKSTATSALQLNSSTVGENKDLSHFFYGSYGRMSATIDDYALNSHSNGSRVRLEVKFTSKAGWRTTEMVLEGVHLQDSGEVFVASDQGNTHGVYFVPQLASDAITFDQIKSSCQEILSNRITAGRTPAETPDKCSVMGIFQVQRSQASVSELRVSELEYQHHSGIPYIELPPVVVFGRLFSTNCNFSIELDISGIREPQLQDRAQRHSVFFILIVILQIYTIIRQMERTLSPSNLWRVSFWTIAAQCLLDGYNSVLLLICGLAIQSVMIPMVAASFLAFLSMALYGLRYLLLIYRMQRQFSTIESTTSTARASEPLENTEGSSTDTINATAQESEAHLTEGEIERRDLGTLYVRFYFSLLVLLFLSLQVAYLPNSLRDVLTGLGLLITNSYWLPQIYRQALLGYRKALSMRYVITTTFCRLVPILYIYGWKTNILMHEQEWYVVWATLGYSWLQIVVLIGQNLFGARFFLPRSKTLPVVHDYHSLPRVDQENVLQEFDNLCAICMSTLNIPPEQATQGFSISRGTYMRTPCNHFFHTACLSEWMMRRLRCPNCRAILPPG